MYRSMSVFYSIRYGYVIVIVMLYVRSTLCFSGAVYLINLAVSFAHRTGMLAVKPSLSSVVCLWRISERNDILL